MHSESMHRVQCLCQADKLEGGVGSMGEEGGGG